MTNQPPLKKVAVSRQQFLLGEHGFPLRQGSGRNVLWKVKHIGSLPDTVGGWIVRVRRDGGQIHRLCGGEDLAIQLGFLEAAVAVHLWRPQGFVFITAGETAIGNAVGVLFARTDITKNHKLGWLKQQKFIVS